MAVTTDQNRTNHQDPKKKQQNEKKTNEKNLNSAAGISGSFSAAMLSSAINFGSSQLAGTDLYEAAGASGNQALLQAIMTSGERQSRIERVSSIMIDGTGVPDFAESAPFDLFDRIDEPFEPAEVPDFESGILPVIDFSRLEMLAEPFVQGVGD